MKSRTRGLLRLALDLGRQELTKRVQATVSSNPQLTHLQGQITQAQTVVRELGKLKGAAMKVGQTLSLELRDLLPPPVIEILSQLQDQSPPMSPAQIEKILESAWTPAQRSKLISISPQPIASASIGQVHLGQYQNPNQGIQSVAIKIQYPGVQDSVAQDIQTLGRVFGALLTAGGRGQIRLEYFLGELQQVFEQETRYESELDFMLRYKKVIESDPRFVLPEPISELCTSKILVTEFTSGIKIEKWLAETKPSAEHRQQLGRAFLDLYCTEFFVHGLVQTDPNPANFLVSNPPKSNSPQLVLLDFGACKEYSQEFRRNYRHLLQQVRSGPDHKIIESCVEMNLVHADEPALGKLALLNLLKVSLAPFDPHRQPFEFSEGEYTRSVREATFELGRQSKLSPPPHPILFLHRKLGGIFQILKMLQVRLNLNDYWNRYVEAQEKAHHV